MSWRELLGNEKPMRGPAQSAMDIRYDKSMKVGESLFPGFVLRRILRGYDGKVFEFEWSPDGEILAAACSDGMIRLWDMQSDEPLRILRAHNKEVTGLAWSPDGRTLASGSWDKTIRLWDTQTWQVQHTESIDAVYGLTWSPDGDVLSWGAADQKAWQLERVTRALHQSNPVHNHSVFGLAWLHDDVYLTGDDLGAVYRWQSRQQAPLEKLDFEANEFSLSPTGELIAAGWGTIIQILSIATWRVLTTIEGHTGEIDHLQFSSDGTLLVSSSRDMTVRVWRGDTGEAVARITGFSGEFGPKIGSHPFLPLLVLKDDAGGVAHVWELPVNAPMDKALVTDSVRYTTARLVVVGDSGVGKTGLGWRLAHGQFREHPSTHGQQFWVVDGLHYTRRDGTECEAVLWDLAGQPVYRLVHAIFLDDVDLALVLFDPTNRTEPLKGAEFWLEQLAGRKQLPSSVLVGARTDRGTAVLSQEELQQFCQRRGISGGYIGTSAATGEGLDNLLQIIKAQIPWEQMTATVTTVTFKRIKEYVLDLKEKPDRKRVLVRAEQLRAQLEATDTEWDFSDAEMMTAVKHLETHGYISVLRSSSGESVILLTPDLLVGLASSIVLEADKHPRDLGALSETELLKGSYPFAELATLERAEQQILLDAAIVRFLSHNICLRETLGTDALLIFPGLIKQKRPLFDSVETTDDVSYIVRGRVENVYAALVVLLGYTQTFTRFHQWQSQAQYQLGEGRICGFRLMEEREGEIELVLYYSAAMPTFGRTMFQGLFEQFLYERDVDVKRFPPVFCPNSHLQQRDTVVRRVRDSKEFLFCDECGARVVLPETGEPQALGAQVGRRVRRAEALARLRSTYEAHLVRVKGFRRDRTPPRCYISHVPEQSAWASQLTLDLRDAGAYVIEDPAQVAEGDFVLLVGTPGYREAWGRGRDAEVIRPRLGQARASWPTLIPLLLEGDSGTSLPRELHSSRPGDLRDDTRHTVALFDLILTLYAIPLDHPAFVPLRESLARQWEQTLSEFAQGGRKIFLSYAWGGESEKVAEELEQSFTAGGLKVVRDKRDLGFKGDIRAFMEDIGRGACVILVISDKYLKSPNCLFELVQVSKHGEFASRVFPVVLADARIYDPQERLGYVKYWEQRQDELNTAMKQVSAASLKGFREDIDLYAEIRGLLPELTNVLRSMNTLSADAQRASGFQSLFEAVMDRLSDFPRTL